MRVLYIDAFSGISGDMTVGALLALGENLGMELGMDLLRRELAVLPVHGYTLCADERRVHGIRAVKFDVALDADHQHDASHVEHHHHGAQSYGAIRTMLEESRLDARAKQLALAIFARLAAAEGVVHGVAADAVTFHEVGAVDSIVDIVGTAIGLVALDIGDIYVSVLPLGSGTIHSQHGVLPVPAPATAELLREFPVRFDDGVGELVTPTGAAIVAALAHPGAPRPAMHVEAIGYGAGTRVLADRPNLLRLLVGRAAAAMERDALVELSTNIDDSSPELYEYVMEQLFAAGARDVWLTPAQMKKNRPATVLHALAEPSARDILAAIILRETSAIGVRFHAVERLMSAREQVSVETPYGPVLVKISRAPDGTDNLAPEYDDCRRVARERRVALKLVYQAAIAAALRR